MHDHSTAGVSDADYAVREGCLLMDDQGWWQAWGQGVTAVGALVTAVGALALGVYNTRQAAKKHKWETEDRVELEARRAWCKEQQAKVYGPVQVPLAVPPDKMPWARWGQSEGLFGLTPGGRPGEWFLVKLSRNTV